MPSLFRLSLLAALLISGLTHASAEAPGLESLYPAGGRAGDRIEVKVLGKGLDKNNPVGWCSNPGVTLQPVPLTGDKAKDKALAGLWHITIAQDAAPGPCLIRFHNNDGSSPPHIFEVGTLPEYTEQEPNDSLKQSSSSSASYSSSRKEAPATPTTPTPPQSSSSSSSNSSSTPQAPTAPAPTPPSLQSTPPPASPPSLPTAPVTLNGLLAKDGDADLLPIHVRKGIPLTFELHGYALGSPMDPAMRLLDERGIELAASHDTHNLDPLIRFTPTSDTTLYVQVHAFVHPPQADIAFKGSANHIYRLHITDSGRSSSSSDSSSRKEPAPPSALSSSSSSSNSSSNGTAPAAPKAPALLTTSSSGKEPAPSSTASVTPSTPPFTVQATLSTPGQESPHTFTAKKGDDLQLTVRAKAIRSPLEAVFRLESLTPDGQLLKVLQTVDDASSLKEAGSFSVLDPALHWKAPADGNYRIVVADRFQNGGPDHHYELEVKPWQPTVTATLADHAFVLQPGKTTDIKLTLAYDGKFPEKEKLHARATGLPPGVTAADVELPAKAGEIKLTLKATPDAAPAQTPFTIEIVTAATASANPTTAAASQSSSSSYSNSSSTPSAPSPPSALESSSKPSSSPASAPPSPSAPAPVTLATYPIPFKDLRGDLLIPTDTHPWLTIPVLASKPAVQDKDKKNTKDAKAAPGAAK